LCLLSGTALAQNVNVGSNYAPNLTFFTTPGGTFTVPAGVTVVYIDGCAPGGSGGGGQASANTAGGGGGGAGMGVANYPMAVTPGSALTITISQTYAGGAAATDGTTSGNTTITGGVSNFPTLFAGI